MTGILVYFTIGLITLVGIWVAREDRPLPWIDVFFVVLLWPALFVIAFVFSPPKEAFAFSLRNKKLFLKVWLSMASVQLLIILIYDWIS